MKRLIPVVFVCAAATAVMAQEAPPPVEDVDLSGGWSLEEMQGTWPDLTKEGFAAIDHDGSGEVDEAELQAAWDNAVLKPVDG